MDYSITNTNLPVFETICEAVQQRISILILGEAGMGMEELAQEIQRTFTTQRKTALAVYKGSRKDFFQAIAQQLNIPTTNENNKPLTIDQLKIEITLNVNKKTVLIFPQAQRLCATIRYWLEDLVRDGITLVAFSYRNPKKDVFLNMVDVELELPSDREIRQVMTAEAQARGLTLSRAKLAKLQPLAGRNPLLARQVIAKEFLNLTHKSQPEHTQYIEIMPILIVLALVFSLFRFVGLGTGDKGLYVTGGCACVAFMALQQAGNIRGAKRRLGQ